MRIVNTNDELSMDRSATNAGVDLNQNERFAALVNNKHHRAGTRGEANAEAVLATMFVFSANRFSSYSPIS